MGFIYHLLQPPVQRPAWQRFAVVAASLILAFSSRIWLEPWLLWHSPFALLLPAVLVSAWYGGARAGLLATAAGGIGAVYVFMVPGSLVIRNLSDAVAFLLFIGEGMLISALCEVLHHAVARAGQSATEAARKFEIMANRAPVLIWSTDAGGDCVFVNYHWLRFTGRSAAQELGRGWNAHIHPADQATHRAALAEATRDQRPYELAYRRRQSDGNYRWLLERAAPRYDADGNFEGLIGSCTDITAARRERDELAFFARLQRNLGSSLDPGRIGVVLAEAMVPHLADWFCLELVEHDTRLVTLHSLPAEAAGFAASAISALVVETGDAQLLHAADSARSPADVARRQQWLARGLESRLAVPLLVRGRITGVLTVATAGSGRRLGADETATLRKIAGLAAFALDNARLHSATRLALANAEQSHQQAAASERALSEQRGLLKTIIDAVPALVAYVGSDGRVVLYNGRYHDLLGAGAKGLTNQPFASAAGHPHGEQAERFLHAALRGETVAYEDVIPTTAGERHVAAVLLPDRAADGRIRGVVFHAYDITERRKAYAELATARELLRCHADELEERVRQRTASLRETNAELEAFTCSVSHDLRTPLQHVRRYAEALASDPASVLSPGSQEHLERMTQSTARMDSIIIDLLGYSRLARADMVLGPVSLEKAVADALQHHHADLQRTGAHVQIEPPLPRVMADRVGLFQILTNLISNALKFVEPGRAPMIRIRAENGPAFTRLWIVDNGIGIPPRHHAKVFQLFERLHGVADYPGTGVGLALVRKAAMRMGGQCGVESTPGAGSRFWIDFVPDANPSRPGHAVPAEAPRVLR